MKVLIISDLHLGDGSSADDFGDNDDSLLKWITSHNADVVYLNGDIYDSWQFKMKRIKKAHPKIIKEFKNRKYKYIRGNHDYSVMGVLTRSLTTKNAMKVLISHGFQNDDRMKNPFLRVGVWFLGILERVPFLSWIDNPESFATPRNKEKIMKLTEDYARDQLHKYDIVICGHTHLKCDKNVSDGLTGSLKYINTGTCQHGKREGAILDTETGSVRLI